MLNHVTTAGRARTAAIALATACVGACVGLAGVGSAAASAAQPQVLLVGTYKGIRGGFHSIEAAVAAARPGAWILIGPGDYKDLGTHVPPGARVDDRAGAQILIRTPGIHLRGMNRNGVVVDGTRPGASPCSRAHAQQYLGPRDHAGKRSGRSGILIYKTAGVTVENLTICNFPNGDLGGGNQIWWDGGAGTGRQTNLGYWRGAFLTATSYYYGGPSAPGAAYGIYSSNTKVGHGVFADDYASNMNDSAYYVGACPDCNVTVDHVHAQNSILGYSGTNSGGNVIIENSEFDHNQDGFDTNSQNNTDVPSPQNGACPGGATGPQPPGTQLSHSCWVFTHNFVHDNNNPNVPATGSASNGPLGTGMSLSGARNDIVTANRFVNNGAWGVLVVPYPDLGPPPSNAHCMGGRMLTLLGASVCEYDAFGNEIAGNTFTHNGFFGNPTNGDLAEGSGQNDPGNCWHGNTDSGGAVTSDPLDLQTTHAQCGIPNSANGIDFQANLGSPLGGQVLCDSQILAPCPTTPTMNYPRLTSVPMPRVPPQATMSDPCRGVPANPWCGTVSRRRASAAPAPHFTG